MPVWPSSNNELPGPRQTCCLLPRREFCSIAFNKTLRATRTEREIEHDLYGVLVKSLRHS